MLAEQSGIEGPSLRTLCPLLSTPNPPSQAATPDIDCERWGCVFMHLVTRRSWTPTTTRSLSTHSSPRSLKNPSKPCALAGCVTHDRPAHMLHDPYYHSASVLPHRLQLYIVQFCPHSAAGKIQLEPSQALQDGGTGTWYSPGDSVHFGSLHRRARLYSR